MPIIENTMKTKLESGQNVYSFNIVSSRSLAIAGIAKECGFDWLFIDTEHNTMDLDTVSALCMAAYPPVSPQSFASQVPNPSMLHECLTVEHKA